MEPAGEKLEHETLSRIAAGIVSLGQLTELRAWIGITNINLHGNSITRIEAVNNLPSLTSLNLSSNFILQIENLQELTALKSLNLASNRLQSVDGIGHLPTLSSLNVSHNSITSLAGLSQLRQAPLQRLNVQNNSISSLQGLSVLSAFTSLRELRVAGNPCTCSAAAYTLLRQALPQVRQLEQQESNKRKKIPFIYQSLLASMMQGCVLLFEMLLQICTWY